MIMTIAVTTSPMLTITMFSTMTTACRLDHDPDPDQVPRLMEEVHCIASSDIRGNGQTNPFVTLMIIIFEDVFA